MKFLQKIFGDNETGKMFLLKKVHKKKNTISYLSLLQLIAGSFVYLCEMKFYKLVKYSF